MALCNFAIVEAVASELQCPVCLELYTSPIILPCSHILCRLPCAERLFEQGFVRCPVCREESFVRNGVESLPRVISLENIIETYRGGGARELDELCDSNSVPCQLCQSEQPKKAVKSCLDCNASYCRKCLKISHPEKLPFSEHQLVEPRQHPKPRKQLCPTHGEKLNIYCQDCEMLGCLLCADAQDNMGSHHGHQILSLLQAMHVFKSSLEHHLRQLDTTHCAVSEAITQHQETVAVFQECVNDRRREIVEQCQSLIAEVESKQQFFLSDLEYEDKSKVEMTNKTINRLKEHSRDVQSLMHYTRQVLKEQDPCSFVQLAKSTNIRLAKCSSIPPELQQTCISGSTLHHKVVDFRKEKAIIRNLGYLTAPSSPVIDVSRCSRSTTSVVLVLCPPELEEDVIDGYCVYYSSTEQKSQGIQSTMMFRTPVEERKFGRGPPVSSGVCLIHNDLTIDTMYYFSVRAYNGAGDSKMSDIVNCRTLSLEEASQTVPVPEIVEDMCRTYSSSIQIYSPSPLEHDASVDVNYYLLYREASADKIWKSISLCGRVDHRVFALEPDTLYDFVVMACHKEGGQCQVSNQVSLRTEIAAY